MLEAAGYRISKTDVAGRQEGDQPVPAHRIYLALPSGREVKVVRSEAGRHPARKCEISRDEIRGLTIGELERLLAGDPLRRFLPRRPEDPPTWIQGHQVPTADQLLQPGPEL